MTGIKKRLGSILGPEGRVPQIIETTTTQVSPGTPAKAELIKIGEAQYRAAFQVPRGLDGDPNAVTDFGEAVALELNTPNSLGRSALNFALGDAPILVHYNLETSAWPSRPNEDRTVFWVGGPVAPPSRQPGDVWLRGGAEWSPASLDLLGWYAADHEAPTSLPIGQVSDLGPRGHDLLQGAGETSGVTLDSSELGIPGYRFEGLTPLSTNITGYDPSLWDATITVIALCSVREEESHSALFDSAHSAPPARIVRTPTGELLLNYGQEVQSASGVWPANTPVVVTGNFSKTAESYAAINGETVITPRNAGQPAGPIARHRIGSTTGGDFPFEGTVSELIIGRNMSRADIAAVTAYLMDKGGIQ